MKPSFSYVTGEKVSASDVKSSSMFTRYLHQELGVDVPVGGSGRGAWYGRLQSEMEAQGWSWADLVGAVQYLKARKSRLGVMDGLFYYVSTSQDRGYGDDPYDDVRSKVSEALHLETDERWIRKLSLAQGKALVEVYRQWEDERGRLRSRVS